MHMCVCSLPPGYLTPCLPPPQRARRMIESLLIYGGIALGSVVVLGIILVAYLALEQKRQKKNKGESTRVVPTKNKKQSKRRKKRYQRTKSQIHTMKVVSKAIDESIKSQEALGKQIDEEQRRKHRRLQERIAARKPKKEAEKEHAAVMTALKNAGSAGEIDIDNLDLDTIEEEEFDIDFDDTAVDDEIDLDLDQLLDDGTLAKTVSKRKELQRKATARVMQALDEASES